LKEDVQFADEDTIFRDELGIPARATFTGEICPDHCHVLVLKDAIEWAASQQADIFVVETAGKRCVYLLEQEIGSVAPARDDTEVSWKDLLDREYDFVLDKFDDDPGPREHILLGNPVNLERLRIKKGDVLIGRPVMGVGCPVTHCGVVMEEPDYKIKDEGLYIGKAIYTLLGLTLEVEKFRPNLTQNFERPLHSL